MRVNDVQSNLEKAISDRKKDMELLEGRLTMEIEIMKKDIKQIRDSNDKDHAELKKDICEVKDTIQDFIKSADKKYASRWVEKAAWGAITSIITAFLGFIIWILQSYINHLK